jgi:protease PrsW
MKLTLNIRTGQMAGRQFELETGFLTIGRDVNCSVRFDPNDRVISGKHAYIEAQSDGFHLTDNGSTNGTFVNGSRIQSALLNSGDTVQFGREGVTATVTVALAQMTSSLSVPAQFDAPGQWSAPEHAIAPANNWRNSVSGIGLRPPPSTGQKSSTGKYVGAGIAIFTVVFLSLIVAAMIMSNLGPQAAVVSAVVAFVPACIYIVPLVWLDRYDPEPLWLLGLAFAWGALVAIIFSATVNDLVSAMFGELAGGIVSAPVFEEGSKGLGVVLILIFFRKEFDDILDGIVYAGTIALGFATVENVLYYGAGFTKGGFQTLEVLFLLRGILSPFAHVTFTSMTGIGCGISRESHNKIVRVMLPISGYGCAMVLHAVWNGMAFLGGLKGFLTGYVILEVPFFIIFVGFSIYVMRRQNKILHDMLALDVARGLITPDQLAIVTSAFKSWTWLLSAVGSAKYGARRKFIRAVGKLGLTYWHIQRASAAHGQTGSFQQNPILREEVIKWRDKV